MMNNKMLAILGTTVISVVTIGSVTFASNVTDNGVKDKQQIEDSFNKDAKGKKNLSTKSCHRNSKNGSKDMIKIMKDNGFEDAAKYMQSGDYDAMTDYMKNISEEDYEEMTKIMNENGYENMGKMMKSIGKKGMVQMHKAMKFMHGNSNKDMMNKF